MRLFVILFGLISFSQTLSAQTVEIQKRPVEIYNTYIAQGFDNNDAVTVTVSGALPNTCYYSPFAEIEKNNGKMQVLIFAYYNEGRASDCLNMKVPFLIEAGLGILEAGDYSIQARSGFTVLPEKKLNVAKSNGGVDNYLYANVKNIEDNDWDRTVQLSGINPSDCFDLDRIEIISNGIDTYSVLPILKQVKEECLPIETRFTYEFQVPLTLERKKVLLHVRVMNGKALTFLY